jgi:putative addiction module CopG family antidote
MLEAAHEHDQYEYHEVIVNIDISDRWESFIRSQVQAGRFASESEMLDEALRLLQQRDEGGATAPTARKAMTEEELEQELIESGFLGSVPPRDSPPPPWNFKPVKIAGEPLSETVVRERR